MVDEHAGDNDSDLCHLLEKGNDKIRKDKRNWWAVIFDPLTKV